MTLARLSLRDFAQATNLPLEALSRELSETGPTTPRSGQSARGCEMCEVLKDSHARALAQAETIPAAKLLELEAQFSEQLEAMKASLRAEVHAGLSQLLTALYPDMAGAALRASLEKELAQAALNPTQDEVRVHVPPALLKDIASEATDAVFCEDPSLSGHKINLHRGGGVTRIDPDAILQTCLTFLNSSTAESAS